ncbi:MAG: HAMP domain-containing protein [Idiomarina sp.]|nr:HAMP domain-containing protein [Idiomarina sp.]
MAGRYTLSTAWQFFLAIAGVGLLLVVISLVGVRVYFTHNFNAYLSAQEQQRLQDLALVIADYYDVQRAQNPQFSLSDLGDLNRGGARRLLAGLSLAQWRDDVRSQREDGIVNPRVSSRFNFRNVTLYDGAGEPVSGRGVADPIRVPIMAGDPASPIGYLEAPRPQGPIQPIDAVFQQQQLSALMVAGVVALSLAAIAAAWLAQRLKRRVTRITSATRALALGDYTTRLRIDGGDELARLSTDVNALARALEASSGERRAFMADIAHELRTPLTILQAELEAIEDGIRSLDGQQMGLLQGQVRQLTQLVEDLHVLAQADVGSLSYQWQAVDLCDWLQQQWPAMEHQGQAAGLTCTLSTPAEPVSVRADPVRLTQLLSNLWANSLRYTDVPGTIAVSLARHEYNQYAVLTVTDSAPGVPDEALAMLSERLYRVDSSRNRQYGGSGLGLAIVKRIAQAHGGQLDAQHSDLGGVTMQIKLPINRNTH